MNLTGKQLAEQGIITNVKEENISQHGIDLNVIKIEKLSGQGFIPTVGKTKLVQYEEVELTSIVIGEQTFNESRFPIEVGGWELAPGAYNVTFEQGCIIPADKMLLIRQRSSLLRNGVILHSSVFDAGFKTDRIGTIIVVINPITIEYGARIAQIYAHQWNEVENLYNGQYQNDAQRKS